jgi:hypothetical protein
VFFGSAGRAISVTPTQEEVLSGTEPFLPQNRADAPHHHPAGTVDRLLDTHFRLLRNDMLQTLQVNVQAFMAAGGIEGAGSIHDL